jgi:tRNA A-37 threonylcarbamoyl transferase component Bud32
MQDPEADLVKSTDSLKKDWSFLDPYTLPLDDAKDRSTIFVREVENLGIFQKAYIKIYANRKYPFQRYLRKSKSRTEVRNLLFFQSIGISTPRIIGWGQRRNAIRRIIQEFIITEAIPDSLTLDQYVRRKSLSRLQAARLARTLGSWLRSMHTNNFYHKDFHWRNILIRCKKQKLVISLIDCPRGAFHSSTIRSRYWRLKDCAILDKYASVLVDNITRSIFLQAYLNTSRHSSSFKKWSQRIPAYRLARFDQKKGRTNVKPLNHKLKDV